MFSRGLKFVLYIPLHRPTMLFGKVAPTAGFQRLFRQILLACREAHSNLEQFEPLPQSTQVGTNSFIPVQASSNAVLDLVSSLEFVQSEITGCMVDLQSRALPTELNRLALDSRKSWIENKICDHLATPRPALKVPSSTQTACRLRFRHIPTDFVCRSLPSPEGIVREFELTMFGQYVTHL